jgi:hypothetical protein
MYGKTSWAAGFPGHGLACPNAALPAITARRRKMIKVFFMVIVSFYSSGRLGTNAEGHYWLFR